MWNKSCSVCFVFHFSCSLYCFLFAVITIIWFQKGSNLHIFKIEKKNLLEDFRMPFIIDLNGCPWCSKTRFIFRKTEGRFVHISHTLPTHQYNTAWWLYGQCMGYRHLWTSRSILAFLGQCMGICFTFELTQRKNTNTQTLLTVHKRYTNTQTYKPYIIDCTSR